MMSTPEKTADVPCYNIVQSTALPPGPPQPNGTPITLQWNMNQVPPGPNGYPGAMVLNVASPPQMNQVPPGPNGYPGAMVLNVASPPPQIIVHNGTQQWTIQTVPTAYVGPPAIPQDTRLANLHKTFLKGKPYALGIVLIVTSILEIVFGISLPFLINSATLISGILFWGPLFYIIAGSLSISAHKIPNVCKVKGSLALNIISSIFSMLTIILCIVDFSIEHCQYSYECSDKHGSDGITVIAFILVMNLLIFSVSVSISVFGCRAVKQPLTNAPAMFVIQNDNVTSMPPSTMMPRTTENLTNQPPPYVFEEEKRP